MNLEEYRDRITGRPENFAYFGELDLETWGTMLAVHRDSDVLERSNWQVINADMQERFPDDVTIQGSSHWAVGWVDELKVNTANVEALEAAYEWHQKLDSYPIADEEHFSELEYTEAIEAWEEYGKEDLIGILAEYESMHFIFDTETLEDRVPEIREDHADIINQDLDLIFSTYPIACCGEMYFSEEVIKGALDQHYTFLLYTSTPIEDALEEWAWDLKVRIAERDRRIWEETQPPLQVIEWKEY